MKSTLTPIALASVFAFFSIAATCQAQESPPTLLNFLGIPQGVNKIRDNLLNRRGNLPGTERTPPLKALSDPAFLEPEIATGIEMPKPLQEAAKVKIMEDLAPQKIKAVKYLAKIGCGCYNDGGAIVDALAEALDDCTEDVRMATIEALKNVAEGETCEECKTKSCCDEKLLLKLAEIAYERDETGCYKEKNEDIREAAIEALESCCPSDGPIVSEPGFEDEIETPEAPLIEPETPSVTAAPPIFRPISSTQNDSNPLPSVVESQDHLPMVVNTEAMEFTSAVLGGSNMRRVSRPLYRPPGAPRTSEVSNRPARVEEFGAVEQQEQQTEAIPIYPGNAYVEWVSARERLARIRFDATSSVPVGARLEVWHKFITGKLPVGRFEVVQVEADGALIRPVGRVKITSIARGDEARFLR